MSAGRRRCYGNNAQACMQHKNENTSKKEKQSNRFESVRPLQVIAAVRQFFVVRLPVNEVYWQGVGCW